MAGVGCASATGKTPLLYESAAKRRSAIVGREGFIPAIARSGLRCSKPIDSILDGLFAIFRVTAPGGACKVSGLCLVKAVLISRLRPKARSTCKEGDRAQ